MSTGLPERMSGCECKPDRAQPSNIWTCWMLLGDFERAWQETDRIESRRRQGMRAEGQLVWDGTAFDGRVVLLRCDHGLDDAIQFIRYVPLLRAKCSKLVVKAKPILLPLLETIPGIDGVISLSDPDPAFDVQIESIELPYAFRTTLSTIPNRIPYIHVETKCAHKSDSDDFTIGLSWATGPWNNERSIRLKDLKSLRDVPGLTFHSLQWGSASAEAFGHEHGLNIRNASVPVMEDLIETAMAISQVDLVVTVDTMIAHLAGALGKPVWVLLNFDCDWRWMLEREDSPWYPTMRLFRQPRAGDWSAPIRRLKDELMTTASHVQ